MFFQFASSMLGKESELLHVTICAANCQSLTWTNAFSTPTALQWILLYKEQHLQSNLVLLEALSVSLTRCWYAPCSLFFNMQHIYIYIAIICKALCSISKTDHCNTEYTTGMLSHWMCATNVYGKSHIWILPCCTPRATCRIPRKRIPSLKLRLLMCGCGKKMAHGHLSRSVSLCAEGNCSHSDRSM